MKHTTGTLSYKDNSTENTAIINLNINELEKGNNYLQCQTIGVKWWYENSPEIVYKPSMVKGGLFSYTDIIETINNTSFLEFISWTEENIDEWITNNTDKKKSINVIEFLKEIESEIL